MFFLPFFLFRWSKWSKIGALMVHPSPSPPSSFFRSLEAGVPARVYGSSSFFLFPSRFFQKKKMLYRSGPISPFPPCFLYGEKRFGNRRISLPPSSVDLWRCEKRTAPYLLLQAINKFSRTENSPPFSLFRTSFAQRTLERNFFVAESLPFYWKTISFFPGDENRMAGNGTSSLSLLFHGVRESPRVPGKRPLPSFFPACQYKLTTILCPHISVSPFFSFSDATNTNLLAEYGPMHDWSSLLLLFHSDRDSVEKTCGSPLPPFPLSFQRKGCVSTGFKDHFFLFFSPSFPSKGGICSGRPRFSSPSLMLHFPDKSTRVFPLQTRRSPVFSLFFP